MPRRKNVVSKVVFNAGDPKAIRKAWKELDRKAKAIRRVEKQALPRVASELRVRVFGPMLRVLRRYPPRKHGMKMRWRSVAQRITVMAILYRQAKERGIRNPKGKDLAYKRTDKYKRGWQYNLRIVARRLRVTVENDAITTHKNNTYRYGKFVGGNIGLGGSKSSMRRYKRPIQPFHTDRGWQETAPIVRKYVTRATNVARDYYLEKMDNA